MYERFTDRSRKVMQLANQESLRFNHEYVGPEHIVLGLLKEGSGVAAHVLKNMDVDLRKLRHAIEKVVAPVGQDVVTMGHLPQTPAAKKVIEHAIAIARELNHNYIGTEHLLLGICRLAESDEKMAAVLKEVGVSFDVVRDEILALLGKKDAPKEPLPGTAEWKDFMRRMAIQSVKAYSDLCAGEPARVQSCELFLSFLASWQPVVPVTYAWNVTIQNPE